VLARLEELDGVDRAEVDFAADFMRLSVRDDAAQTHALQTLNALGYGAAPVQQSTDVARWYDRRSVGELSRVEAEVISGRVTSRYAERHEMSGELQQALRSAIATSLHASFAAIDMAAGPSPADFRRDCVARAVSATTPLIGARDSAELGAILEDDLQQPHHKETRIQL